MSPSRMGHLGVALSQEQDGDHWGCCRMGQGGLVAGGGLLFPRRSPKPCCYMGT